MAFPFRFLKGCVFETPHKAVVNALERFLKPALDRIGWKWMQDFDPSVQQLDEFVGFGMSITAIWNNRTFLSALFYSLKASQGARIEGSERERWREREVRGRVRLRWHWSTGLGIRFSFVLFFVVEWRLSLLSVHMCGSFEDFSSGMLSHILVSFLDLAAVCPVSSGLIRGCLRGFLFWMRSWWLCQGSICCTYSSILTFFSTVVVFPTLH